MPRSMWKGAISFGLVHIPVDMYPAVANKGLDLTMLDRRDFSPVGFKRYNKGNGKEVSWDDIVKGYEYSSGEYVVLSDEDLRRANPEATQTIDIVGFVDAEDVSLLYFEQPYYLAPGKGGDKVYALLRETLRKAGKIGIARVVIRVKQHLCALVCVGDAIVLNTLRYADELRDPGDLKIPAASDKKAAVTDKELKMAMALVQGMAEDWEPEQYHDSYREDVMALIEKKVKAHQTKTITMPEPGEKKRETGKVIDLVSLLQASLGKKPGKAAPEEDDDDDDEPPPSKKRKTAAADDEEEAPAPRARKAPAHSSDRVAASGVAPKRSAAKGAPKAAAKKAAAKTSAAPARRKKAA
ncbi:non-homologous end joining protein Ku [Massilia yuzhufengensis]|uniref:Non-homologous end joining protein Ku n=1 Tax=Massilia yuzhufengensis TaxID=1164594 RepID=A0A1I1PTA8_9BURK|nr:Ku protein [Massilia yuzhufengensis]SFD10213.1 DNA end-binding protein Ku [Massilia yuzhufengensis]